MNDDDLLRGNALALKALENIETAIANESRDDLRRAVEELRDLLPADGGKGMQAVLRQLDPDAVRYVAEEALFLARRP